MPEQETTSRGPLPRHSLRGRWLLASRLPAATRALAERELLRATESSGWNPKVLRLRRNLHMIDLCADGPEGGLHSVRVVLLQDHPFLRTLEALGNAPRSVKTLYRKETRLAHERAHEAWPVLEALDRAHEAWHDAAWRGARFEALLEDES